MTEDTEGLRRLSEELNRALARFMPREPRYRYFQRGSGPMFFWTVKKAGDGRYHSGAPCQWHL